MKDGYLIDTQILIWSIANPEKLKSSIKKILTENTIYVSQTSLMEITIKQTVGKLPDIEVSIKQLIAQIIKDGFKILTISNSHIELYATIPLHQDHKDPFDRFLLATALAEDMPIISADKNFRLYKGLVTLIEA